MFNIYNLENFTKMKFGLGECLIGLFSAHFLSKFGKFAKPNKQRMNERKNM